MIEAIQYVLAPAVMISAGALICLAQFARYTAVIAQLRSLHGERISTNLKLSHAEPDDREVLLQRAKSLDLQSTKVLAHATTVRNALRLLVWGVLLMVLCSLTVGASLVFPSLGVAVVGLFILGLVATSSGLYLVLAELRVSLEAIEFDQESLKRL